MAHKIEFEREMKAKPAKFWEAIENSTDLFAKIFPEHYKSIEIVKGDGKSAGSVRIVKYAEGIPTTFAKEKIDIVDEENKLVSYSIIDGEATKIYKNFKKTIKISPNGDGTLLKMTLEYDNPNKEALGSHDVMKKTTMKIFEDLDAYLLVN